MLGMSFGTKPIKENVKPSICAYMVQHRVIISIVLILIFLILFHMTHSFDSPEIPFTSPIKLSVSNKMLSESVTAIGQPVRRDQLLRQRHNPLEMNEAQKSGANTASYLRHHGLKRFPERHRKPKNMTWKNIRNSSIPIIASAYFTAIELNISSHTSYSDYQYQSFNQLRTQNTHTCDYMSIHGLQKSGTELLEYILRTIANQACLKTSDNSDSDSQLQLSICNHSRIGDWDKYKALLPIHYSVLPFDIEDLYHHNIRVCVFTIFRDVRDRAIAWKNKGDNYELIRKDVLKNTRIFARKLKVWFNFYGNLENKYPLQYFNMFYEDFIFNLKDEIVKMINYIGLHNILDENDIGNIISSMDLDALKQNNIEMFDNVRSEKNETICQMENELSDETIEEIYVKIKAVDIQPELLRKFNETCIFPHNFFN